VGLGIFCDAARSADEALALEIVKERNVGTLGIRLDAIAFSAAATCAAMILGSPLVWAAWKKITASFFRYMGAWGGFILAAAS
jgi:hypothetical protein